MAVYFDYLTAPTSTSSPAFDPNSEIFTFLSYKATDWCNKVGPNYAELITGHPEWEASQRNQDGNWGTAGAVTMQLLLKGPEHRSGALLAEYPTTGTPWTILGFRRSSNAWYMYISNKPSVYTDLMAGPSGWDRSTYGNFDLRDNAQIGYANSTFNDSYFSTPRTTYTMYSDTPGRRFFAWHIHGWESDIRRGCVKEMIPAPDQPVGSDCGWSVHTSVSNIVKAWPLTRFDLDDKINRWKPRASSVPNIVFPTGGVGSAYTTSSEYGTANVKYIPLSDAAGEYLGYEPDVWAASKSFYRPMWNYKIDGKLWMAWDEQILLPLF